MGVQKIASGYRVRVTDATGQRLSLGVYPTLAEAREALANAKAKKTPTFREYGQQVLDQRELSGLRGVAQERARWRKHVLTWPQVDLPISKIRPSHVLAWLRDLKKTPVSDPSAKRSPRMLSHSTILLIKALLSSVFTEAIGADHIEFNPALVPFKAPAKIKKINYLSRTEIKQVVDCKEIRDLEHFAILFAIGTGLRQGEQWAMPKKNIKHKAKNPHVLVEFGAKNKPPKNGKARRVPLFGVALKACLAYYDKIPSNDEGLAFPTITGQRRQIGKLGYTHEGLKNQLAKAGVHRKVRWHDLRHTFASALISGSWGPAWSLEQICTVMGHSSVTVTEIYAHLADDPLNDIARLTTGE